MFEPVPDDIAAALAAAAPRLAAFGRLHYRAEIGSTNDAALGLALAGAPEGTSVLADQQTHGRGRRGHDWFSPPGFGIYLSVIVRPRVSVDVVPVLTLAAGVAVAQAVRDVTGFAVDLKWPNDIVVGRPWRKLGGVLSEAASVGAHIDAVIVGIGLNVGAVRYPPELALTASSLESELGRPVERASMVVGLLERLRAIMDRLHLEGRDAICSAWREFGQASLGAVVRWQAPHGECRGRTVDIAADGALLVDVQGRIERVIAGGLVWES